MNLIDYRHAKCSLKPNYLRIPVTVFNINEEGAHNFNEIWDYAKANIENKIIRTPSGGISYKTIFPAYDVKNTSSCVELTLCDLTGMYRFQFRHNEKVNKDNENMYGRQAWSIFKSEAERFGINLDDYIINNGEEVKKTIEKPYIRLESEVFANKTLVGVHHIDFHNSYPAGLANTHPEFRPLIEHLYEKRKENNGKFKKVLNLTIGFMQSLQLTGAKWAHLSRDAIKNNNDRIRELAKRLRDNGRVIISYNTDGIWYLGEIYHGEGEGSHLGEWENDHTNCKFRARSAGAYEYIEDGKYYPVVRGMTRLDKVKSRDEWEWGDIYNRDANIIMFTVTEEGVYVNGKKA